MTTTAPAPKPSDLFPRRPVVPATPSAPVVYQPTQGWNQLETVLTRLTTGDDERRTAQVEMAAQAERHRQAVSDLETARRKAVKVASETLGGPAQYQAFLVWLDENRPMVAHALRRPTLRQELTTEEITQRQTALERVDSLVKIFKGGIPLH